MPPINYLPVNPNTNAHFFYILIAVTTPNDNALACQIRPPGPIGYGIFMKSGYDAVSTSVLTLVRADLLGTKLKVDDIIVRISTQVGSRRGQRRSGQVCC